MDRSRPTSRPEPTGADALSLEDYEAVPYLLVVESVERGGRWLRRAAYPELDCAVEAPSVVEALDRLEGERRRLLRDLWDRRASIPVPRAPLRRGAAGGAG
jgi:hypothetical protein